MADIVQLDVPLFIRLLELAREDIKDDADIHDLVQRAIELSKNGPINMGSYNDLVGFMKQQGKEEGYNDNDIKRFRQIVDLASQRGAFRGAELTQVGAIFDKLNAFLTFIAEQQKARDEATEEEATKE